MPNWRFFGVSLLVTAVLLAVYVLYQFGAFDPHDVVAIRFDSAAWKRADPIEKHRTVRSQMVDDLIRQRLLIGLARGQVEALLGASIADPKMGPRVSQWHMSYHLGLERAGPYSLDEEFLEVRLNDEGRVVGCRTVVN